MDATSLNMRGLFAGASTSPPRRPSVHWQASTAPQLRREVELAAMVARDLPAMCAQHVAKTTRGEVVQMWGYLVALALNPSVFFATSPRPMRRRARRLPAPGPPPARYGRWRPPMAPSGWRSSTSGMPPLPPSSTTRLASRRCVAPTRWRSRRSRACTRWRSGRSSPPPATHSLL